MKTRFSLHAYERINGRLSLSHAELASLLDADHAVNIGQEPASNRMHRLFFSANDGMCFVAIQDMKCGTVITVLPIDFHNNICWAVSLNAQLQARRCAEAGLNEGELAAAQLDAAGLAPLALAPAVHKPAVPASDRRFKMSGVVTDGWERYVKLVGLGTWPTEPYGQNIEALIADVTFRMALAERIADRLNRIDNLTGEPLFMNTINIQLGQHGPVTRIPAVRLGPMQPKLDLADHAS